MKTRVLAALALAAASARVCVLAGEVLEDERAPSKSDLAGRVDPAPAELAPVTTHKERVAQRRREWKLNRTRAHDAQHKHTHAESATCYGRRYPDLAYAFCKDECNVQALHRHFQSHGRREGRRFGCEAAPLTAAETAKWKVHEARLRAKDPTPTVALFSYNFGNFRGEISRYRKQTQKFSCAYDRFFFTDLVDVARPLADDGWILFKVPVEALPRVIIPRDVSDGWKLTKYFKFGHIPRALRSYEYTLHVDFSSFAHNPNGYIVPEFVHLSRFLRLHNSTELVLWKHGQRSYVFQEWKMTVWLRMEKVPNIRGFARSVGHRFGCAAVSKVPLFELGVFVRKNNNAPVLDHMFVNTFRTLIAYGLKRDQNVFSFAVMHHLNMTKGNWVLQCPKEARLPSHERGMLGRCGAPVFPSVGTTSSNASHHGCAHFGLPY